MVHSKTIGDLLARAAEISMIDDRALAELGRRVLETLILDPATPAHLKDAAAQLLSRSENAPSPSAAGAPDDAHD